jgi:hypothetical protein
MATPKEMNRTSGVARRKAPLDKYTNITNAETVRGLIRSGGPITGSASGVRSISSVDAFNTLGQFFVGEALGLGLAAGAAKVFGFVAPKVSRAIGAGARPMTVAERSASVTRAGRTGVGYIGQGNFRALQGSNYMGKSRYDLVFDEATRISRGRVPLGAKDMSSTPFGPFSNNVPAYLRRSGMSPAASARAKSVIEQIERDQIERSAIRNQAWAFFQGRGGRGVIKDLDRVYEGSINYGIGGPKRFKGRKKGPKK